MDIEILISWPEWHETRQFNGIGTFRSIDVIIPSALNFKNGSVKEARVVVPIVLMNRLLNGAWQLKVIANQRH